MCSLQHLLAALVFATASAGSRSKFVQVKLVEPHGKAAGHNPASDSDTDTHGNGNGNVDYNLKPRVPHSNFTGPALMKALVGKCFSTTSKDAKYEYRVCPFDNVTQHDLQASWNAYNGVLGIWHTWALKGDALHSMTFFEGDAGCGGHRQTSVSLDCGATAQVLDPTEPEPCHYALHFVTPLACGNVLQLDALLSKQDMARYRELGDDLYDEHLTPAGHRKRTRELLQKAEVLPTRYQAPQPTPMPAVATATAADLRQGASVNGVVHAAVAPEQEKKPADASKLQSCRQEVSELGASAQSMQAELNRLHAELSTLGWKDPVGAWLAEEREQEGEAGAAAAAAAAAGSKPFSKEGAAAMSPSRPDAEAKPDGARAAPLAKEPPRSMPAHPGGAEVKGGPDAMPAHPAAPRARGQRTEQGAAAQAAHQPHRAHRARASADAVAGGALDGHLAGAEPAAEAARAADAGGSRASPDAEPSPKKRQRRRRQAKPNEAVRRAEPGQAPAAEGSEEKVTGTAKAPPPKAPRRR